MGRPSKNPRYSVVSARVGDAESTQIRLYCQRFKVNRTQVMRKAYESLIAGAISSLSVGVVHTREV